MLGAIIQKSIFVCDCESLTRSSVFLVGLAKDILLPEGEEEVVNLSPSNSHCRWYSKLATFLLHMRQKTAQAPLLFHGNKNQ